MDAMSDSQPLKGQTNLRRPKLNPARLERKRATDRETQRAIRAKTKSYIEHLESTVQRYESAAGDDLTRTLATQVSEQHAEILRLRAVVRNAHKTLESAITGKPPIEVADDMNATNPASIEAGNSTTNIASVDNHQPETTVITSNINPTDFIFQRNSSMGDAPASFPTPLRPDIAGNLLECGEGNDNYLGLLNTKLTELQSDCSFCPLTSAAEDEDVAIRAVFQSWAVAEERHSLDSVWKVLQAIDQGLFYRSGQVERVAVLKLMRSLLLLKINPYWQHPTPKLPAYMTPCEDQLTCPHLSVMDFFVWPSLRSFLITSNITFLPEFSATLFASSLRFKWQFEPSDVYLTHAFTGRYVFAEAFKRSLEDLSNWALEEDFFSVFPALSKFVPKYDRSVEAEETFDTVFGTSPPITTFPEMPLSANPIELVDRRSSSTALQSDINLDAYDLP
jgi:hypothetical protein